MYRIATLIVLTLTLMLSTAWGQQNPIKFDFEATAKLPEGWSSQGNVTMDTKVAFMGKSSLLLQRAEADVEKPCSVTSAPMAVTPGNWRIALAVRSELKSPDSSFNGVISLEYLNREGKVLDSLKLVDIYGVKNWQAFNKRVEVPVEATAIRLHAQLNKASGQFWIDEISASFLGASVKKNRLIDRIVFATAQSGNLLFPEDVRTVKVSVMALQPLGDNQRELSYVVRDYWGAECSISGKVALGAARQEGKKLVYEATLDLSAVALEMGRYYELYAAVPQEGELPFSNYTTLAILPMPVTKNYKPEEIPFTSRNWEGNIADFFFLADRIGVRISNVWSGWSATPPYAPKPGRVDLCEKLGMGMIAGSPTGAIERHAGDWQKYDEKALREGVRNWIATYGKTRPLMFSLGNEPPVIVDRLPANVAGYKAVYEEIKKVDPNITVIASSVVPAEEFFKAGFQNYCDVVDFHAYEDWKGIRETFVTYDKLFAKYGGKKPIWSTEIGLNSQGLARQTVAATLIKKITSFFASGGASVSWFDLGYPDPDVKLAEDSTTAHNVFDCRYARYCPKLDAIAYYNMINGICVKKAVGEKVYGEDTYAFLFRDRDNHCLQVIWKEKGRQDVLLPLPGVGKVTAIDIDGRRSELDAGGAGLTLTINEDPMLLLYDSADAPLAQKLGDPAAKLLTQPEGVIKGGSTYLDVILATGLTNQNIELVGPMFWSTDMAKTKRSDGAAAVTFSIKAPENTSAREGNVVVRLKDGKGAYNGELRTRVPVTGRVAAKLMPEPMVGGKPAGVRLQLQNFSTEKQEVTWMLLLSSEMKMNKGIFDFPVASSAYFADAAEGTATIAGKGTAEVVVPLAGIDPLNVYRVKAIVTDSTGRALETERFMAGFVQVPHVRSGIKLDGTMADADWQRAPAVHYGEQRQYFPYGKEIKWKGASDLSGTMQFLWDEKYLYVGVKVTDDVFANNKVDGSLWAGDGLQFLVDPARDKAFKPGKYDMAVALTKKGPQAWCYLSADSGAPSGEIKDMIIAIKRLHADRGDMNYVLAIPWSRVAPFKPAVGANLGLGMVINEDDGAGRTAFMGWFADVQSKQVDTVGDLILGE